jgi:hypothetical protein
VALTRRPQLGCSVGASGVVQNKFPLARIPLPPAPPPPAHPPFPFAAAARPPCLPRPSSPHPLHRSSPPTAPPPPNHRCSVSPHCIIVAALFCRVLLLCVQSCAVLPRCVVTCTRCCTVAVLFRRAVSLCVTHSSCVNSCTALHVACSSCTVPRAALTRQPQLGWGALWALRGLFKKISAGANPAPSPPPRRPVDPRSPADRAFLSNGRAPPLIQKPWRETGRQRPGSEPSDERHPETVQKVLGHDLSALLSGDLARAVGDPRGQ